MVRLRLDRLEPRSIRPADVAALLDTNGTFGIIETASRAGATRRTIAFEDG